MTERVKVEVDHELIFHTMQNFLSFLNNIACAKYGQHTTKEHSDATVQHIIFCRNVLINMVGNFVLEKTDYTFPEALQSNIDEFIESIKHFFEQARLQKAKQELQS